MSKRNIIIDCDPGHDDVMAILLALANQDKFNILGVTTVAGNQTLEKVTLNLRKLYTYLGISTPVASGCAKPIIRNLFSGNKVHGEIGLTGWDFPEPTFELDSTNAITFMYEKIMSCKGMVTLIPIGPLTNIGLLLLTFPDVKEKIETISIMGGAIYAGNITSQAEFNIYVDPEAASIVFNFGISIIMSGLEVTHEAGIMDSEIKVLMKKEGRVSKMCGYLLNYYSRYHKSKGYVSFPLHDVCSVMYLLYPEIFEYKYMKIDIDCSEGIFRGKTIANNQEWKKHKNLNTKVLLKVDREEFIKKLFQALEKLDNI